MKIVINEKSKAGDLQTDNVYSLEIDNLDLDVLNLFKEKLTRDFNNKTRKV